MATVISPLFTPFSSAKKSSLISDMENVGKNLISQDSDYLDKVSHPSGRYNIGVVDLGKSHGPYLFTDRGEYYDATYSWMTDILDPMKHEELRDPDYLFYLGRLAQEDRTPTEDKTAIQAEKVIWIS